jgi:hypothetical protein
MHVLRCTTGFTDDMNSHTYLDPEERRCTLKQFKVVQKSFHDKRCDMIGQLKSLISIPATEGNRHEQFSIHIK